MNGSRTSANRALGALVALVACGPASGQQLPAHDPLRILIVSDEVNPHGLNDAALTQPGDLSAALTKTEALNIADEADALLELPTNQLEVATAALERSVSDPLRYDALIYFAHRIPNNGDQDAVRQEAFVAAVTQFLQDGGGVISFHHGAYLTPGKASMQQLLGSQATGSVPWNTTEGQNVIFVGGNHFIGTHAISYDLSLPYANPAHGISSEDYPAFNNVPDERYPQMDFLPVTPDCDVEVLFESNYQDNGTMHLLGYTKWCSGWASELVVYQPGEYQPQALLPGNNFQILLNALFYVTHLSVGNDQIMVSTFENNPARTPTDRP